MKLFKRKSLLFSVLIISAMWLFFNFMHTLFDVGPSCSYEWKQLYVSDRKITNVNQAKGLFAEYLNSLQLDYYYLDRVHISEILNNRGSVDFFDITYDVDIDQSGKILPMGRQTSVGIAVGRLYFRVKDNILLGEIQNPC
jgi:hypothetical protein